MTKKTLIKSSDVMSMIGCCENTLLKLERLKIIPIAARVGNRKRYDEESVLTSIMRHHQSRKG